MGSSAELKITSYYTTVANAEVVEYDETTLSTVMTSTSPLALSSPDAFFMIPPTEHGLLKVEENGTQPLGPITFRFRPTANGVGANDFYLLQEVTTTLYGAETPTID